MSAELRRVQPAAAGGFPQRFYSGLYFYVDSPRNDLQQVAEVNAWLRENCTGENSAYMICHGVVYSPDVFRISALPDESIREILPYGACNPGNDAFPKELAHGAGRADLYAV